MAIRVAFRQVFDVHDLKSSSKAMSSDVKMSSTFLQVCWRVFFCQEEGSTPREV